MSDDTRAGIDYPGVTVVFFCHDGRGNLLLGKRTDQCRDEQGRWDPGGGELEFGQDVVHCLREEVRQEYGADVLDYYFLGYRTVFRWPNNVLTHWIALDFMVLVEPNTVINGEPEKKSEVRFFPANEPLPEPGHSQLPYAWLQYRKYFLPYWQDGSVGG